MNASSPDHTLRAALPHPPAIDRGSVGTVVEHLSVKFDVNTAYETA